MRNCRELLKHFPSLWLNSVSKVRVLLLPFKYSILQITEQNSSFSQILLGNEDLFSILLDKARLLF